MLQIDDLDRKILSALAENCKLSAQQLAEVVGASPASVWRRIKSLEETGVISGYEARIDLERIGFELTAFAHVTLNRHSRDNVDLFEEAVRRVPEILSCYSVTGQYDFIILIQVRNIRDYELFLNDAIFKLPGVEHVHSNIALKTVKSGQRGIELA